MAGGALLLLLGSGSFGCQERRFEDQARAAALYDRGLEALEAGQPQDAVEALREASQMDPGSPELRLWLARAWAASGEHQAAVQAAGEALERRPGWGLAHYNRACWRAQLGQLDLAWLDLKAALDSEEVDRFTAAQDPDLEPLRSAPAFEGRVPQPVLPFSVEVPSEPVFLGSRWIVALEFAHRASDPAGLTYQGAEPGVLELLEVRELQETGEALVRRRVEFVFKVQGAGQGELGPWLIRAGTLSAEPPAHPYVFLAPEGHLAAAQEPLGPLLLFPSERFSQLPLGGAARDGARVWVRGEVGDRLSPQPPGTVHYELREQGQVLWQGWSLPLAPGESAQLTRGQTVVFDRAI